MSQKLVMKKILEECSEQMSMVHRKQLDGVIDYVLFEEKLIDKWLGALLFATTDLNKKDVYRFKNEILAAG